MNRKWLKLLALLAIALPVTVNSAPGYRVETVGACTSPDIPDAVKNVLQDQGFRVVGDSGPLCEIWFRKLLPQTAGSGTDYSSLAAGTFVGVIHYLSKGGDYRGQTVKPGTYILRYQTMPSDGNHMGVSPTPDYLVLTPPAADKDPNAVLEYQDLIKLGKQASGASHLHPLYLTSPEGSATPAMRSVDENHWALEAKVKAQPKGGAEVDLPIALVLVGKAEA